MVIYAVLVCPEVVKGENGKTLAEQGFLLKLADGFEPPTG
jgi:hypothetical protein